MNKPSRSMNVGVTCTVKRSDVMNNQFSFNSPQLPRGLQDRRNPLGLAPSTSQESLVKEVLHIIGSSPLTTAKNTVTRRIESLRTPRQVDELLLDNGNRLDFLLQNNRSKASIEDYSDDENDIDK